MSNERSIYFAGAIRGGRDDQALYFAIIERLREYGRVLTEHIGAAQLEVQGEGITDREIHDRDLAWLKEADYVVADVTIPSLGVGYEIGKATEWGKPVLCLFRPADGRALSAMIAGSPGIIVRHYESAAALSPIFADFFDGPHALT
jgi:2'-deoxynucleoside 5'-phosphate N-hydrolase